MPIPRSPDSTGPDAGKFRRLDWVILLMVLSLACLTRLIFYTGLFGSDEVDYTVRAIEILRGESSHSYDLGSNRYGVNLPVAGFMALFGTNEFAANLWSLFCSIAEVGIVFAFAHRIWGLRAAIFSTLVLGLLPLHVHFAGRLMADAPLCFFTTLSFLLFWIAEQRQNTKWYLGAGIAMGCVYWVKEEVLLYAAVFALYPLVFRRWHPKWIWVIAGAFASILLNCLFMWAVNGDPLHLLKVVVYSVSNVELAETKRSEISYYFRYLFLDIRHTWVMGYLALSGVLAWGHEGMRRRLWDAKTGFVVWWGLGLLLLFSLFVVPWSPPRLIPKQTNYMLIFAAPLGMLAGYGLARLKGKWLVSILFVLVSGSLLLSALEQQAIRVFTANSWAALEFASRHADTPVYGTRQATAMSSVVPALRDEQGQFIRPLAELGAEDSPFAKATRRPARQEPAAYVLLDMETLDWSGWNLRVEPEQVPDCWQYEGILEPQGFGVGETVLGELRRLAIMLLPEPLSDKALAVTDRYYRPRAAHVYAVPSACRFRLSGPRPRPH